MFKETKKILPKNLNIVPSYSTKDQNYENAIACKIELNRRNEIIIETSEGKLINTSNADELLKELIKYNKIITYCPKKEFDLIFRFFSYRQLLELDINRSFQHGNYIIYQFSPTKINIRRGNKWTSIYNVYLLSKDELTTPLRIKAWLDKLTEFHQLFYLHTNISSISASSKLIMNQIVDNLYLEHRRLRVLTDRDKNLVVSTIHNTWMEPEYLGAGGEIESIDSTKAHLRALGQLQSISGRRTTVSRARKYTPHAAMGFYQIEFNWPNITPFALAPLRLNYFKSAAPYGPRIQYLPKPYLDKLTELKIPFKVLNAIEFIPHKEPIFPFEDYARYLETIIDKFSDQFYPLELKVLLYKTLVGFMFHYHMSKDQPEEILVPSDILYEASDTFNPMIVSTVYALVNISVFDQLTSSSHPIYRRHDGISRVPEDSIDSRFRRENSGDVFIYTSILYDKPLSDGLWQHFVERDPDSKSLNIIYPNIPRSRHAANNFPELIGTPQDVGYNIRPSADTRIMKTRITRIGDLLEGPCPTEGVPNIDDCLALATQSYPKDFLENQNMVPELAIKK